METPVFCVGFERQSVQRKEREIIATRHCSKANVVKEMLYFSTKSGRERIVTRDGSGFQIGIMSTCHSEPQTIARGGIEIAK